MLTPVKCTLLNSNFKSLSLVLTDFMNKGSAAGTFNSGIPFATYFTAAWALDNMHALSSAWHGFMNDTVNDDCKI